MVGRWNPYLVLVLAMLAGSANQVVGRSAVGEIPPITLALARWSVALLVLLPLAGGALWRARRSLRRSWLVVLALAATAIAPFNTLLYLGLEHTTSINASLVLASIPLITIACSWLFLGHRAAKTVVLGVLIGLGGVLVIISRGDPTSLADLALHRGDLLVLLASICWGLYGILLTKMPGPIDPMALLLAMVACGVVMIAPFFAWERIYGPPVVWSSEGVVGILYIGVVASVVGFGLWNLGVAKVGPNVASQFIYLQPVFGGFWAIVLLGEPLETHHLGILLVFLGIFLATRERTGKAGRA
ncbi:MAG: DMT family transporter [Alphaproteobacteria bacterium]|nr:DMT family transporter [Alphaproteobacteria bacterium]